MRGQADGERSASSYPDEPARLGTSDSTASESESPPLLPSAVPSEGSPANGSGGAVSEVPEDQLGLLPPVERERRPAFDGGAVAGVEPVGAELEAATRHV